jgi:ABC-2 type transport system permease protein
VLVVVVALVTLALVVGLSLDVAFGNLIAATTGLWLLVVAFGTVAFAAGAVSGRRAIGLGVASALAVAAFMLDALGPNLGALWMQSISPWSWYIADRPLTNGWDGGGLVMLLLLSVLAGLAGLRMFTRRDLMV